MIETIWQWHVDAGGNLAGFVVGLSSTILFAFVIIRTLVTPRKNEISDEDFFNIVLDDEEHEIHKAMDKDDYYS